MRNLSKTMVSKKVSLIIKEKYMKKFIMIVIVTVMAFVNNAQADEISFTRYVMDTVPGATVEMAQSCAKAYHHGGTYRHMDAKLTLTCTKGAIREEYDPSKI